MKVTVDMLGGPGSFVWTRSLDPLEIEKWCVNEILYGNINFDAGPGAPLCNLSGNNGELCNEYFAEILALFKARMHLLMYTPEEEVESMSAAELAERYLTDVIKVHVKDEPHSEAKIKEGRFRLIAGRGFIDQLVERWLYGDYQARNISRWHKIPTRAGMGHTDAMNASTYDYVKAYVDKSSVPPNGNDAKGWDFSNQKWKLDTIPEVQRQLRNPPPLVQRMMRNHVTCLGRGVWLLRDGSMFAQLLDGIVKSGSFITADGNGIIRITCSNFVTLYLGGSAAECWCMVMGDDCVENSFGGLDRRSKVYWDLLGVQLTDVKEVVPDENGDIEFEFCSHLCTRSGAELMSWPKSLFKLIKKKDVMDDDIAQFLLEVRGNRNLSEIKQFLRDYYVTPILMRKHGIDFENRGCFDFGRQQIEFEKANMKQTPTKKTMVAKVVNDHPQQARKPQTHKQVMLALNSLPAQQQKSIALAIQAKHANQIKSIQKMATDQRAKVLKEERKGMKKILVPERKKDYGTPANGVNHNIQKFSLSAMQAALLAWAHTVLNPRTLYPHPVPLGAVAGGSSAAEARMYQVTLYGTAVVNADGCFHIGVNADGWAPAVANDPPPPVGQKSSVYGTYLTYPGANPTAGCTTSTPVTFTLEAWAGNGGVGSSGAHFPDWAAHNATYTSDGSTTTAGATGLDGCSLPVNFCPSPYDSGQGNLDARYNMVSSELRLRPEGKLVDQSGDIGIFNWRGTPTKSLYPSVAYNAAATYDDMLTVPDTFLSRNRLAVADWPSNKWLSAVANPNTVCAFDQIQILDAVHRGGDNGTDGFNNQVGFPAIFAMGKGLEPGTAIEFEVTYNYAIYGIPTFQTGQRGATDVAVGGDQIASVVQNGMRDLAKPVVTAGTKENAKGVASVVRSEQMAGNMPTGGGALSSIVGGVKAAIPVIESVTGSSIGETIADVLGGLGALLL